ncbi:OmpA family protein [Salinactinospora qingdaonensis]
MNVTPPKKRPEKIVKNYSLFQLPAFLAILLLSGCVISDSETPQPNGEPSTASSSQVPPDEAADDQSPESLANSLTTSTTAGKQLSVEVYRLERRTPNILRLDLGITNKSNNGILFLNALSSGGKAGTAKNVTLLDLKNRKRYHPLELSNGSCYCSDWRDSANISPGQTLDIWIAFPAPPENLEKISVITPITPPLLDIPIGESQGTPPKQELANPQIVEIRSFTDKISDSTGRAETGEEIAIMLSSDVLFDFEESSLTDKANQTLERVAKEIDSSGATTVEIDGHTDNKGVDEINIPLSEARAKSVSKKLKELIKRDGINYEVAGHGSSQPVASNDSEKGRAKNRRVTVKFEK